MIPSNCKLLLAVLIFALVSEIASTEEKKVMRRKKVLPSREEVDKSLEAHYRIKKQMIHPLVRESKKCFAFNVIVINDDYESIILLQFSHILNLYHVVLN